jgi:hypothetical protein
VVRLSPRRALASGVPWDRLSLVDLTSTGAGEWLRAQRPWITVAEASPESADCVLLGDVGEVPRAHGLLRDGGLLVALLPEEELARLADAGFVDVSTRERLPGGRVVAHAWRRAQAVDQEVRVREVVGFLYARLDPYKEVKELDPERIVAAGGALCEGYAIAAREMLQREGFETRWITMIARDIPHTNGPIDQDSHEVVEVNIDGRWRLVDPTADVVYDGSLAELLADPERAKLDREPDERFKRRRYRTFVSPDWYSRVRQVAERGSPRRRPRFRDARDWKP